MDNSLHERRRKQRHEVGVQLEIIRIGDAEVSYLGTTRNISTGGGVSFRSLQPLDKGVSVEYFLTLSENKPAIRIGCVGQVARCITVDDANDGSPYEIAVTMTRYWFLKTAKEGTEGSLGSVLPPPVEENHP